MYSRAIVLASTGVDIATQALGRATEITAISVRPNKYDVVFKIRDGGATGAVIWSGEADNGAGSYNISFGDYPLRVYHTVYVEAAATQAGGGAYEVCLGVAEP